MGGVREADVPSQVDQTPDAVTEPAALTVAYPAPRRVELLAPAWFELPRMTDFDDLVHIGTPATSLRDATYYDSADLALAVHGSTVVRRADGLWTLEGDGRELSISADSSDGGDHEAPRAIRDRLHTQLRSRPLRAVARLAATRTEVELFSPAPTRVAQVTYDDVTAHHASGGISRFGRVVLTVSEPGVLGTAILRTLVDEFTAAGCTPAPPMTDLQLACGVLSPPGPAPRPPMPERPRSATMADLVAPMLSASLQRLLAHDVGVRLGAEPEDVHQLRVATRRLRADLRALRPVLDRPRAAHLRSEVSWLGSLAGPVRDADVLLERLTAAVAPLPEEDRDGGSELIFRLVADRRTAHDALLAGMRSARYDALLDALVEAVAHPPLRAGGRTDRPAARVLSRATIRRWREFTDAVARAGTSPTGAELHRVRIAAKHARYTAETAAPVLGKHATRLAALAARVQTSLGDLHDAVVAEGWLLDAAGQPELTAVADRIAAAARDTADDLQSDWRPLWRKIGPKAKRELKALRAR